MHAAATVVSSESATPDRRRGRGATPQPTVAEAHGDDLFLVAVPTSCNCLRQELSMGCIQPLLLSRCVWEHTCETIRAMNELARQSPVQALQLSRVQTRRVL